MHFPCISIPRWLRLSPLSHRSLSFRHFDERTVLITSILIWFIIFCWNLCAQCFCSSTHLSPILSIFAGNSLHGAFLYFAFHLMFIVCLCQNHSVCVGFFTLSGSSNTHAHMRAVFVFATDISSKHKLDLSVVRAKLLLSLYSLAIAEPATSRHTFSLWRFFARDVCILCRHHSVPCTSFTLFFFGRLSLLLL